MGNLYVDILRSLAENRPVSLQTHLQSDCGLIKDSLTRRLAEVKPVTDLHGRSFARVTTEWDGDAVTVNEPVLPQERLIVLGGGHIAVALKTVSAVCASHRSIMWSSSHAATGMTRTASVCSCREKSPPISA